MKQDPLEKGKRLNGVNNKEHQYFLEVSSACILACALSVNLQRCEEWQFIVQAMFSSLLFLFPLFIQCDGGMFPFPVLNVMEIINTRSF